MIGPTVEKVKTVKVDQIDAQFWACVWGFQV